MPSNKLLNNHSTKYKQYQKIYPKDILQNNFNHYENNNLEKPLTNKYYYIQYSLQIFLLIGLIILITINYLVNYLFYYFFIVFNYTTGKINSYSLKIRKTMIYLSILIIIQLAIISGFFILFIINDSICKLKKIESFIL